MLFFRYFKVFKNIQFFKEAAYKAICLKVLQDIQALEFFDLKLARATLRTVNKCVEECEGLTLEDFGLTKELCNKLHNDEIHYNEAFAGAVGRSWFDPAVMAKSKLIQKPESVMKKLVSYFSTLPISVLTSHP
mgnify:CR=1 FL=1